MRLGSLFDGIGGWQLAAVKNGIVPVWASEIEKFPIEVTKKHFPAMKHLGNICDIKGNEIEPVDIICMGSPCFTKGTLVLTNRGFIPIEDVRIGDKVVTHTNQWQIVTHTMVHGSRRLYKVNAQGTLETTATYNHPYYIRRMSKVWDNEQRRMKRTFSEPTWVETKNIKTNDFVGYPIIKTEVNPIGITKEEAWLMGRYVADGYINESQRKDRELVQFNHKIILCIGSGKTEYFKNKVKIHHACPTKDRTVIKFTITDERLVGLCKLCGCGAAHKEIPSFVMDLPMDILREFMDGYMSGDGCYKEYIKLYVATTVSRKLIFGLQAIVHKLYRTPCKIYFCERPNTCVIEGRTVNQRNTYSIAFKKYMPKQSRAVVIDDCIWMPVTSCTPVEDNIPVYNLEVANDHSYTANGCIVHNCQNLSIAGNRKGLDGEQSSLFTEGIRIIREMRDATNGKYPRWVVWENVPGAFSSNKRNDFRIVLEEITETEIPMPKSGKWAHAGMVRSDKCEVAWRVLDAQYWGVPQPRKRIFLVADFGGRCAGEILFKPESVPRNPAKSESEGQGIARTTTSSLRKSMHCYPLNTQIVTRRKSLDAAMGVGKDHDPAYNLLAAHCHAVFCSTGYAKYKEGFGTLRSSGGDIGGGSETLVAFPCVRRLTPLECERLQGLPEGYTLGGSDSARYKALGNGMAQPCADFVIKAIMEVENATK